MFKTVIFFLEQKERDRFINCSAYYWQFSVTLFHHTGAWLGKIHDLILLNLRSSKNKQQQQQQQRRWGAVVVAAAAAAADCGSRVSGAFRWMWACVRPRHRATSVRLTGLCCRMTRLCCTCDKDKLQPLENISAFFFLTHALALLHTSLLFFGTGCSPNACHTKGWWWSKGRGGLCLWKYIRRVRSCPRNVHRSGSVFYDGTWLLSADLCTCTVHTFPLNRLKRILG